MRTVLVAVAALISVGLSSPTFAQTTGEQIDDSFMAAADRLNDAEIALAQIGEQNGSRKKVTNFATRLITDTAVIRDALQELATAQGITLTDDLDPLHTVAVLSLPNYTKRSFDRNFLAQVIQAHESAISLYTYAAAFGADATVKAFAQSQLPGLRAHLKSAQRLQNNGGKKDNRGNGRGNDDDDNDDRRRPNGNGDDNRGDRNNDDDDDD